MACAQVNSYLIAAQLSLVTTICNLSQDTEWWIARNHGLLKNEVISAVMTGCF